MSSSSQNGGRAGAHRTRAIRGRRKTHPSPWDVMVRLYNREESAALEADWDGGIRASVGRTFDRFSRVKVFKPSEFDQISSWLETQARDLRGMHRHVKHRKIHRRGAEHGKRRATMKSPVRKASRVSTSPRRSVRSGSKQTSHSRFTGAPSKDSQRGTHR